MGFWVGWFCDGVFWSAWGFWGCRLRRLRKCRRHLHLRVGMVFSFSRCCGRRRRRRRRHGRRLGLLLQAGRADACCCRCCWNGLSRRLVWYQKKLDWSPRLLLSKFSHAS